MIEHAIYRIHRFSRSDGPGKDYRFSLSIADEYTRELLASADVHGLGTLREMRITDRQQRVWRLQGNRKIMPSRWLLRGPDDGLVEQFQRATSGRFFNPLGKVALIIRNRDDQEVCRLVEPGTPIAERPLEAAPGEWVIVKGEMAIGKFMPLPDAEHESAPGLLGRIRRILTSADRGLVSSAGEHCLAPPVGLALSLLLDELMGDFGA